jgi:hypothetical protein
VAIRIFQSFLVVYPCLKIPAFVRSPSVGVPFCQLLVPLLFFLAFSSGFGSWCWRRGGQWVSCFTVLLSTSLFLVLLCYSLFLWFFFFCPLSVFVCALCLLLSCSPPQFFSFSVALYLSCRFPLAFSCSSVLLLFFFPSFLPFFPSFSSPCSWLFL